MAEVKRLPQWIMLEALRNNASVLALEQSDETYTGFVQLDAMEFDIDTAATDPVLKLSIPKTLTVVVGDTITAIVLVIDDTDAPTAYGAGDNEIRCPIGGVDGETFPDGGSIDVTEFEVYLNDL